MENQYKIKKFPSEHLIQTECIAYYRNEYERHGKGVIIPVPNELAAKRKDVTICKGASDTIVIHGLQTLFIEFKTGYNTQSSDQIAFESLVKSIGYPYHIIRSLEDFKAVIGIYQTNPVFTPNK